MAEHITTLNDLREKLPSGALPALTDLLYMVAGTGSDRDRAYTLEEVRNLLQTALEKINFSKNDYTLTADEQKLELSYTTDKGERNEATNYVTLQKDSLKVGYDSNQGGSWFIEITPRKIVGDIGGEVWKIENGAAEFTQAKIGEANLTYDSKNEALTLDKILKIANELNVSGWKFKMGDSGALVCYRTVGTGESAKDVTLFSAGWNENGQFYLNENLVLRNSDGATYTIKNEETNTSKKTLTLEGLVKIEKGSTDGQTYGFSVGATGVSSFVGYDSENNPCYHAITNNEHTYVTQKGLETTGNVSVGGVLDLDANKNENIRLMKGDAKKGLLNFDSDSGMNKLGGTAPWSINCAQFKLTSFDGIKQKYQSFLTKDTDSDITGFTAESGTILVILNTADSAINIKYNNDLKVKIPAKCFCSFLSYNGQWYCSSDYAGS